MSKPRKKSAARVRAVAGNHSPVSPEEINGACVGLIEDFAAIRDSEDYRELAEVAITAISEHATGAAAAHMAAIQKITELAQMALLRDGKGKAKAEEPKPQTLLNNLLIRRGPCE